MSTQLSPRIITALALLAAAALAACGDTADQASSDRTRVVEHELGTAEIPIEPERVFLLSGSIDNALALGIEPIGASLWGGVDDLPEYIASRLNNDFAVAGTTGEPDFETIASLEPDLIIATDWDSDLIGRAEAIAPTIVHTREDDEGRYSWRFELAALGSILDLQSEAEAILQAADERITALNEVLPDDGQTLAALRVRAEENRWYTTDSQLSGGVLQALTHVALVNPAAGDLHEDALWTTLSDENLIDVTADWIYLVPDNPDALEALESLPVWERNPAVQEGQVCVAQNFSAWMLTGPEAVQIVADEVEECLGGQDGAE